MIPAPLFSRLLPFRQATALNNPAFRSLDVNFSYPIRMYRIHEGLSLEPTIVFYNVTNFGNSTELDLARFVRRLIPVGR